MATKPARTAAAAASAKPVSRGAAAPSEVLDAGSEGLSVSLEPPSVREGVAVATEVCVVAGGAVSVSVPEPVGVPAVLEAVEVGAPVPLPLVELALSVAEPEPELSVPVAVADSVPLVAVAVSVPLVMVAVSVPLVELPGGTGTVVSSPPGTVSVWMEMVALSVADSRGPPGFVVVWRTFRLRDTTLLGSSGTFASRATTLLGSSGTKGTPLLGSSGTKAATRPLPAKLRRKASFACMMRFSRVLGC
ncbi:uncharacterized protein GGS25DRAFT_243480 [Hypoxylon fragiforme]|uniref:uncharacterized protein n=1 Tax=Hypoxylon fragiforme TaxID=63214 RepID=UPI0020C5BA16|nr:uncharacterized protein GGS25DRAFT_243480 [Hypoxylon fragiforme]KAI2610043.1 hypothetical protein GGS25DRAFT_243480 [Hypoxylon fragiforme]